ncbi:MAG: hypothetical protein AUH11_05535 [Acidobacteria bacterium 13_2_20CM_57_17]|nr:MAG: hypothetical protein AUH11_05535 [Acidobacteria bacterium 13_2_20CM_57_17]
MNASRRLAAGLILRKALIEDSFQNELDMTKLASLRTHVGVTLTAVDRPLVLSLYRGYRNRRMKDDR